MTGGDKSIQFAKLKLKIELNNYPKQIPKVLYIFKKYSLMF